MLVRVGSFFFLNIMFQSNSEKKKKKTEMKLFMTYEIQYFIDGGGVSLGPLRVGQSGG